MTAMIITPQSLPEILYKGVKVITTDLLARFYETEQDRIIQGFNRNLDRFEHEKHFFKLEGSDLKEFKNYISNSDVVQISNYSRHIYLWTKRGAARHSKIIGTDKAWDMFDALEEHYFKPTNLIGIDPSKNQSELLLLAYMQSKKIEENQKKITEQYDQIKRQEPYVHVVNHFLESETTKSVRQVAKELGIGEKKLFQFMRDNKITHYEWINGTRVNVPYQKHIDAGHFVVISRGFDKKDRDGNTHTVYTSKMCFTAKGQAYISCKLKKEKKKTEAAILSRQAFFERFGANSSFQN